MKKLMLVMILATFISGISAIGAEKRQFSGAVIADQNLPQVIDAKKKKKKGVDLYGDGHLYVKDGVNGWVMIK